MAAPPLVSSAPQRQQPLTSNAQQGATPPVRPPSPAPIPSVKAAAANVDKFPGFDHFVATELRNRTTGSHGQKLNKAFIMDEKGPFLTKWKALTPEERNKHTLASQHGDFHSALEGNLDGVKDLATNPKPPLPEFMKHLPNAPVDPRASPDAMDRFSTMAQNQIDRANAGRQAVYNKHAEQILNPAGTVDRNIAAKNENLAQSGITDMGGGRKILSNKYGTGVSLRPGDPGYGTNNGPHIIEKGQGVKVSGDKIVPDGAPVPGGISRATMKEDIAAKTAGIAPGASDRLAADRTKAIARQTQENAPMVGAAKTQLGLDAAPTSAAPPVVAKPTVPGLNAIINPASQPPALAPSGQPTMPMMGPPAPPPSIAAAPAPAVDPKAAERQRLQAIIDQNQGLLPKVGNVVKSATNAATAGMDKVAAGTAAVGNYVSGDPDKVAEAQKQLDGLNSPVITPAPPVGKPVAQPLQPANTGGAVTDEEDPKKKKKPVTAGLDADTANAPSF